MKCEICGSELIDSEYFNWLRCPVENPNNGLDISHCMTWGITRSFVKKGTLEDDYTWHSHFTISKDFYASYRNFDLYEPKEKIFFLEEINFHVKNKIIIAICPDKSIRLEFPKENFDGLDLQKYPEIVRNYEIIK